MGNNHKPEIRFPGYIEDWKQIRLGDRATIKGRLGWKSLKQEEYTSDGPSMIAGKHIKNGVIDWNVVDHIPQWRYDESPEIMLKNGDVIFSKDGSLGNPALISDLNILATINSTMMLVRVDETIDSSFFYQIMKSEKFERLIHLKVSGSSIPHLFQADMNEFMFLSPVKAEQIKIGKFLKQLDDTIALYQQELATLQQTKQGFIQKMFPKQGESVPEVRFPNFTEDWEEHRVSEIGNISAGGDIDKSKLIDGGEFPVLANALTNDGIVGYYNDYKIVAPAVTITGRGDVGHAKARHVNFTAIVRLLVLKPFDNFNVDFLELAINNTNILVESTGVPQLTAPQMGNYKVSCPTLEEQNKIGNFFKRIDRIIALHQCELDALKETKKAFLQKMFV